MLRYRRIATILLNVYWTQWLWNLQTCSSRLCCLNSWALHRDNPSPLQPLGKQENISQSNEINQGTCNGPMELRKAPRGMGKGAFQWHYGQAFPSKSWIWQYCHSVLPLGHLPSAHVLHPMRILWLWASRICRQSQRALWDLPTSHSMRTWLCYWPSVSFESYTQSPMPIHFSKSRRNWTVAH